MVPQTPSKGTSATCALAAWAGIALLAALPGAARAQGFPNVFQPNPGALLAGPIAPEQGRTAIVAWHGERIVSVPEPPGSQPGADLRIRVVDISNLASPQVTLVPASAGGFNSHGYFHSGAYLYIGPHCLTTTGGVCTGGANDRYTDAFRIGGAGPALGTSQLRPASIESETGLAIASIGRSGAQAPWGAEQWWSYGPVQGDAWVAVRRTAADWVYDWGNGGAPVGPAIQAYWDQLGTAGVIGFPFIVGDTLFFASDQTGTGVASYDISDPTNPVLLDVLKEENPGGYWPEMYGHYLFFPRRDGEGGTGSAAGFMVVDISDPTDLRVVADRNLPGSNQYVTFQDEFAFMNRYKIDMRTFEVALELETVPGLIDASQFALPVGNLVVTGGYGSDGPGLAVFAHQSAPDTRGPFVAYHVPRAEQTNYSIHCPIVLSIPETLRTETIVPGTTLIVRPVGGPAIPIWHSFSQGKVLTVTPRERLLPNTTYEVVLTSGIQDAAGNGMEPYTFRFSTGNGLTGGNTPPTITGITTDPTTGTPNAPLTVSWTATDTEPGTLEYRVDFGDGTPRTGWTTATSMSHTYTKEGHFTVTVQARDSGGAISARTRTVTVAAAPTAPGSTASAMLAADTAAQRLYAVNPDTDTVTAISTATNAKLWEVPVGRHPSGIARGVDGSLWVACRDSDEIRVLDANGVALATIALPYGARPVAVATTPDGASMLVTSEGDGMLRRYTTATRAADGSLVLGPMPRAIAVTADGARALVTRFISGEHAGSVYDVSLAGSLALTRTIALRRDFSVDGSASGRGVPNYLAGITIDPDGRYAWVVGKKDNTTRGTFTAPNLPLGQDNTVRAMMMLVDLATNAEDRTLRLDIDNSDSPTGVAFSPLGDYAFVSLQGNAKVAVIDVLDFLRQDSPGTVKARWQTGIAPQSLLAAGDRLYAANLMGRSVTAIDLAEFLATGNSAVAPQDIPTVGTERLSESVLLGKQIFYHASDPRMSAEGYMSCATCHVDGSHDGRTFDFTNRGEGFRNTTDLRGRSGTGHGMVHWSANFDEIQDFENDIREAFGGAGFLTDVQYASVAPPLGTPKAGLSADLDALADYVTSLGPASLPRSPHRNADGTLTAAALRGQALFNAHNCASCHNPATDFTDSAVHDVGTLKASSGTRLGQPFTSIKTPSLLGAHASAPYLHDGSAATIEEVFTTTGGRLAQAEDGALSGSAAVDNVPWHPMKEWHGGGFVVFTGAGSLTFSDVQSPAAGPGYVELRYNVSYSQTPVTVVMNGVAGTPVMLQPTGNDPSWMPNEWRRVRIPVTYQAGTNTVAFVDNNDGGELKIDDILFSTPGDAANASAHVRGFSAGDLADIAAYVRSLDGSDAARGNLRLMRAAEIIPGTTDVVQVPANTPAHPIAYTIENSGTGPLNIGRLHIEGPDAAAFSIAAHPLPHLRAGEETTLLLHVSTTAAAQTATLTAWSDAPDLDTLTWTVVANPLTASSASDAWMLY
jgi:YVTN family beta-propeller protein